jgi:uncharacterized protein YdhG (YjbR/CyaY superfamily)
MYKSDCRTIDEYISSVPQNIQIILEDIRQAIRTAAPEAEETINYQIPTFKLNGSNLVHFAAYKNHISFYPTPSTIKKFRRELSTYKYSKGAVQFSLDRPIPLDLVMRMVTFRVEENLKK